MVHRAPWQPESLTQVDQAALEVVCCPSQQKAEDHLSSSLPRADTSFLGHAATAGFALALLQLAQSPREPLPDFQGLGAQCVLHAALAIRPLLNLGVDEIAGLTSLRNRGLALDDV